MQKGLFALSFCSFLLWILPKTVTGTESLFPIKQSFPWDLVSEAKAIIDKSKSSKPTLPSKKQSTKKKPHSLEDRIRSLRAKLSKKMDPLIRKILSHPENLRIVIYKNRRVLELWSPQSELLKTYKFTAFSGTLGPKNKQGDKQIPEGVYRTTALNPNSRYYLSIRINYPNDNDTKRAKKKGVHPGGDIYIHGKNKTIGCVPIGDRAIEELFYIVHEVGLGKIKVILSPGPLTDLKEFYKKLSSPLMKQKYQRIERELKSLEDPETKTQSS